VRLGSCAQLGPVLLMACNSVLGIEPGSFVGKAGAAGIPPTGGAHDADSATGGVHDGGAATGGVHDAGSAGVHEAGSAAGGDHDAGSPVGGAPVDAGSSAGRGAGTAGEAQAGAWLGGAGGAAGSGGAGNAADGGGDNEAAGGVAGSGGGECTVGQTLCVESTLQTCGKDGRWTESDCTYACVPKQDGSSGHECGGTCSPGTTWCDGAILLGSCDDSGTAHIASCAEEHGNACVEEPVGSGTHRCDGECVPGRWQCSENTAQLCSERGTWRDQTACDGQTCIESSESAGCQGECAPDQLRCDDQGAPQQCVAGLWVPADACSSSEEDFQVCREGRCELADHYVGPSEAYDDTVTVSADFLFVFPLPELQQDAILLNFNVIGGPDTAQGVSARMVLYQDDGSGRVPTGEPVAQTEGLLFQLLPQRVSVAPSAAEPRLRANTIYWVGIVTAQEATLRGQSGSSGTGLYRTWGLDFNEAFESAETGILYENTDVNLFLQVRDID
jgi:hypothetical protein